MSSNGNEAPRTLMAPSQIEKAATAARERVEAEFHAALEEKERTRMKFTGGLTPGQTSEVISKMREKLLEKNLFTEGQLIMAKPGLADFNIPAPGYPVIVHQILKEPVLDGKGENPTNTRCNRAYDMVVMAFLNGSIVPFHVESSRFEPYKEAK